MNTLRRTWTGPWLMTVAAGHTLFGLLAFPSALRQLAERGLFNSVGNDPMAGAVAWFMLFGAPLALLGWTVLQLDRAGQRQALRGVGWGLLGLTLLGLVLMPVSGFWLVLPVVWALLRPTRPTAP